MKSKLSYAALLASALMLQACGGGKMLGSSDAEDHKMTPEKVVDDGSDKPRPSATAPVMKTSNDTILDANGNAVLLRGINVQYGDNPLKRVDGITSARDVGSNVVRIQLRENTTAPELEAALNRAGQQGLVAILSLWEPKPKLACTDNEDELANVVNQVWLKKWLPVLAQDRYQNMIMINIASDWGPDGIFDAYSTGYKVYIDNYKAIIRQFRTAGFNVPIVIDAPCGKDFNAFLGGRAKELLAADTKKNLVLSVKGYGPKWNTAEKVVNAFNLLSAEKMPVIMSEFGGSNVVEDDVKHMDILNKAAGDWGLALSVPWATATDKAAYNVQLSQATSLKDRELSIELYVADAYVKDGTMGMQVYLRDKDGKYANMGWNSAGAFKGDAWNTLNYKIKDKPLGWTEEGFDITQITKVGVELVANGKAPEVKGDLKIDNIKVIEGSAATELYSQSFDTGTAGWETGWANTVVGNSNGALSLTRDAGSDQVVASVTGLGSQVDFSKEIEITAKVYIPASYTGSWVYFKFFAAGTDWQATTDLDASAFTFGGWAEVSLKANFPGATGVGLQMGNLAGSTEAVLLDDFKINGVAAASEKVIGVQYTADFDSDADGWGFLSWSTVSAKVEASQGALVITPKPESGVINRVVVEKNNWTAVDKLDMTDNFKLKMRVKIPASYADTDYYVKIFLQDVNWSNHFDAKIWEKDTLVAGEWNDLEVDVQFPAGFAKEGAPKHFGFEVGGNDKADAVLVDDFTIEGPVPVEKEEVVVDLIDFFYSNHFQNAAVDFAEGGLTKEGLADSYTLEQKFKPFGWLAWSWIGNAAGFEGWDLSHSESSSADLTERGEDIVNGKGGLAETSVPVFNKP